MRSVFVLLAVMLVSTLFVSSCWGGGGRTLWDTNPQAGLLPAVQFAFTGVMDLVIDEFGIGGWFADTNNSVGVEDEDTGASVVMLPDTYLTVGGSAPTWLNLGVGPLDTEAANASVVGMWKIGGAKIIAETSLGSSNVEFSRNLTITLPVIGGYADGTEVYVYRWTGSSWQGVSNVSQYGGFSVMSNLVALGINQPGNYGVFVVYHSGGGS